MFWLVAETHCSANKNAPNTTGVVVTVTVTEMFQYPLGLSSICCMSNYSDYIWL